MHAHDQPAKKNAPGLTPRPAQRPNRDTTAPRAQWLSPALTNLQRTRGNTAVTGMHAAVRRTAVDDVLRSPGQSIAAPLREEMEAGLGADFSQVRVHTDDAAAASAAMLGARAYTSGNQVVIGPAAADRHTLAHELTHVIQQRQGPVSGIDHGSGLRLSDPSDRFERAAETAAEHALRGDRGASQPSADVMGARAAQSTSVFPGRAVPAQGPSMSVIQRANGTKRKISADEPDPAKIRRTSRISKVPFDNVMRGLPTHFEGPKYIPETKRDAGGMLSEATISPNVTPGSAADPRLPAAIDTARANYPGTNFIAGHLLNRALGGSGEDAKNLTILTSSANGSMKKFDNPIQNAVNPLTALYEKLHASKDPVIDITRLRYGSKVMISVSTEKWGNDYPDNCIANKVHCAAEVVGNPGPIDKVPAAEKEKKKVDRFIENANKYKEVKNSNPAGMPQFNFTYPIGGGVTGASGGAGAGVPPPFVSHGTGSGGVITGQSAVRRKGSAAGRAGSTSARRRRR